jgi:hypothetical protein
VLKVTGAGMTWINNLAVDGSISVAPPAPPTLNFAQSNNTIQFSWAGSFKLQDQTNSLSGSNRVDYPGGISPITITMDPANASVFFRLVSVP